MVIGRRFQLCLTKQVITFKSISEVLRFLLPKINTQIKARNVGYRGVQQIRTMKIAEKPFEFDKSSELRAPCVQIRTT